MRILSEQLRTLRGAQRINQLTTTQQFEALDRMSNAEDQVNWVSFFQEDADYGMAGPEVTWESIQALPLDEFDNLEADDEFEYSPDGNDMAVRMELGESLIAEPVQVTDDAAAETYADESSKRPEPLSWAYFSSRKDGAE